MAYKFKLPYGLRKDDNGEELIHISEIQPNESGLKCNCVCPNCGVRLQAKLPKNKENFTPRFAHHDADTCDYATETALHMKAKEIIEKVKHIVIPKVTAEYKNLIKEVSPERKVTFDYVILEHRVDNIIPDILAYKDTRPLMIEIKITHGIDDIKLEKIKNLGISTIEVDLSDMDANFDPDILYEEIVLNTKNKHWIYNSVEETARENLKAEYLKKLKEQQEIERKAEERRKRIEKRNEERRKGKADRVAQLLDLNYQESLKKE